MAGCIVIVKSGPLDDMYIQNDLPVVIVKDWAELNSPNLTEWKSKYIEKTKRDHILPRLKHSYWIERIVQSND